MPKNTDHKGGDRQATVLAPDAMITTSTGSLSQAQLGDEWWQTMYAIPRDEHLGMFDDATDPEGRRGSVEKALNVQFDDSVLFLGGVYGDLQSRGSIGVTRTIVLPNEGDTTVFFPLLNIIADNIVTDPDDPTNLTGDLTVEELQNLLGILLNAKDEGGLISILSASVDGNPVSNPLSYRQVSETAFSYTIPFPVEHSVTTYTNESYLDNVGADPIQLQDLAEGDQVTITPAVANGYYLAVDITGGDHILNFGGTYSFGWTLDITYNILNPVEGGSGKDNLNGTKGNDYIDGGSNSDKLMGQKGDDLIVGGDGVDLIDGGKGSDELWGDTGIDTFVFKQGYGEDKIFDFTSGEIVKIPGLSVPTALGITDTAFNGIEAVQINFGGGDLLTFVGLNSSDLMIQKGSIVCV